MSLMILENIVKEYGNQTVLNGVSLRIERGERVALIGPNGAGKTTLIKIALGLERYDEGSVTIARNIKVGYLTQDLKDVESRERSGETALHYEKVYKLERRMRELERQMEELSEGCGSNEYRSLLDEYSKTMTRFESMDGYTVETKIKKILFGLGLREETLDTPIGMLSGGEKMRIAVARILLEEPDLLVLDEPTNHLDIQATEWFESFLKKFEGGILLVSHDRYFLDRVTTRVAELENGTLCVRSGNYSSYMEHKKQLHDFVLKEQRDLKWNIKNQTRIAQNFKHMRNISAFKNREKQVERLKDKLSNSLTAVKSHEHLHKANGPKIRFKKIEHVSKDIAWAENLKKSFGDVTLFDEASFHIRGGEKVGIIGPNGCGKTTLINMLIGNDKDYEGFLRLGEWVKYSYMGQEVLFENENISMLDLIKSKMDIAETDARGHLARFQFYGDVVDKFISVLSGGERVRLYLALVMLEDTDCLILDEPTNHLDVPARDAVEASLKKFNGTIIAITHDRYYLTHCVEKILEIENGRINTYNGNYDLYRQLKYGITEDSTEEKNTKQQFKNNKANKTNTVKAEDPVAVQKELESRIIVLEDRIKEMESLFDKSTSPEKYREYNNLLNEVNSLYSKWDEIVR